MNIIWIDSREVGFYPENRMIMTVNHASNERDEDGDLLAHRFFANSDEQFQRWYRLAVRRAERIAQMYREEKADLAASGNDPNNKYFHLYN